MKNTGKSSEADKDFNETLTSAFLQREVVVDYYFHQIHQTIPPRVCIVHDGQDLVKMDFRNILQTSGGEVPIIFAAVHCGKERVEEYGMRCGTDYLNRGKNAAAYEDFIIKELLPLLISRYPQADFSKTIIAGFSMGGLKALDIAWNNPGKFDWVAVFSGSLWWRSVAADDPGYHENLHRMMHRQVAESEVPPNLKFFFQCGEEDESADRNKNGVIDSIDDTIDLMKLLHKKGKLEGKDFFYYQMPEGKHDISSWAEAWPVFLQLMNNY
jgi:enterochelin esterase-like enzyme